MRRYQGCQGSQPGALGRHPTPTAAWILSATLRRVISNSPLPTPLSACLFASLWSYQAGGLHGGQQVGVKVLPDSMLETLPVQGFGQRCSVFINGHGLLETTSSQPGVPFPPTPRIMSIPCPCHLCLVSPPACPTFSSLLSCRRSRHNQAWPGPATWVLACSSLFSAVEERGRLCGKWIPQSPKPRASPLRLPLPLTHLPFTQQPRRKTAPLTVWPLTSCCPFKGNGAG